MTDKPFGVNLTLLPSTNPPPYEKYMDALIEGGVDFAEIQPLVAGARGREALEKGEPEGGLVWGGQVVGLIDDIPTRAELLDRVVAECRERLTVSLNYYS